MPQQGLLGKISQNPAATLPLLVNGLKRASATLSSDAYETTLLPVQALRHLLCHVSKFGRRALSQDRAGASAAGADFGTSSSVHRHPQREPAGWPDRVGLDEEKPVTPTHHLRGAKDCVAAPSPRSPVEAGRKDSEPV